MQLRTVLFCSFFALPALAACGDDTGGGTGGDSSTTGTVAAGTGSTTAPAANSSAAGTGGDPSGGTGGDPSGGTGGDPSGGTGGDPSGGTGGGTALSCDTYCDTIASACEDNPQYPDDASCLAACAAFPEGTYADGDGSLGCHQYHSDAAVSDPDLHCGHAGPMGDGQCAADPCENFCVIAPAICPGVYASTDVCEKVCAGFDVGEFSVDPPATGNTLGCRMYHLTVAAINEDEAGVHCAHTAADSDQCL
jgi:hypothetical protein